MLSRRSFLATGALAPLALAPGAARAMADEVFAVNGLAIGGIDPVGYFRHGAPVPGDPAVALMWRGAEWRFESRDSRALFEADARSYAPAYGGYCAYAMASGDLAASVPEAWTIHGGRLFLNLSLPVQEIWRQDIAGYVARADRHWPGVLDAS